MTLYSAPERVVGARVSTKYCPNGRVHDVCSNPIFWHLKALERDKRGSMERDAIRGFVMIYVCTVELVRLRLECVILGSPRVIIGRPVDQARVVRFVRSGLVAVLRGRLQGLVESQEDKTGCHDATLRTWYETACGARLRVVRRGNCQMIPLGAGLGGRGAFGGRGTNRLPAAPGEGLVAFGCPCTSAGFVKESLRFPLFLRCLQ